MVIAASELAEELASGVTCKSIPDAKVIPLGRACPALDSEFREALPLIGQGRKTESPFGRIKREPL